MALRFVLDENLRGLLWRAVVRHNQAGAYPLDVARVGDPPDLPLRSTDPDILLWCEREERILVSFDKTTLAVHLANHLQAGHHSPGIFMMRRRSRLAQVVAHLALVAYASDAWEWQDGIEFIPYDRSLSATRFPWLAPRASRISPLPAAGFDDLPRKDNSLATAR